MINQSYPVFTENYFKNDLIDNLKSLDAHQSPNWGIMTPQHMVEHLIGSWLISNGKFQVSLKIPKEKVAERRLFLFGDDEFKLALQSPMNKPGELNKLRKASLSEAIETLKLEINIFFDFHNENPNSNFTHPVFEELNKDEWLLFQTKHVKHHLKQFGIV